MYGNTARPYIAFTRHVSCDIADQITPNQSATGQAFAQIGRLHLPPALLQAPGLLAPHLALFSLAADCSGARSMKSRGNLQRAVHG
jgi:hypothetical protein